MEIDFWSMDVPLDCKKDLEFSFRLIKFGYAILMLNLVAVVTGQYILDNYAPWPIISRKTYPYYRVASMLYVFGGYFVAYTHFVIYSYACFHTYCQILLLNEYFKHLVANYGRNQGIQINVTEGLIFGIKQYNKLVR